MKKIALILTGGTISMKADKELKAVIPALSDEEIISTISGINKVANIEAIRFTNMPGPHITPKKMFELSQLIDDLLMKEEYSGAVITHGTDTLEETSYLLDLCLQTYKPVVLTGSMKNSSELGYDGPANLSAAICTAIDKDSYEKGVLVVMNDHIYAANEVIKTHTLSLDTFKSLDKGPLGIVDQDQVIYYRCGNKQRKISVNDIEEKVGLIKCYSGMESGYIDYLMGCHYKGIVVEAMGRGNVPPKMIEGIKKAINHNIPVVIVSICPSGRVLGTYGYEGGGNHLRQLGVILGGDLSGQKARIKLMTILGAGINDIDEIKEIFEDSFYKTYH
ncbi:L-asparaginase [Natranaerovirga hydrolytica]|uniref:L-asparaginase n=1 Tax=Natranaerovirga hydrolytica TaxID=680378 RepID=A0A4V2Q1V1_9FIRM|nr:asparaginase [Natranaerovirga hydrolytica]TCK99011.1 L-asparaginase [Natranaerovirga hydrolytica]